MQIITENISIASHVLTLTNQRAIHWKEQEALILSDIHIGKTAHFRKHGIPIPDAILQKDLKRLAQLLYHFKVKKVIIVGDLFHAGKNSDITTFKNWLSDFPVIEWVLVKGNHDTLSKGLMDDLNIEVVTELTMEPFKFVHDNIVQSDNAFTISGHTHPGVLIKGKGRQRMKLPCYQLTAKQLILPAFSLFTGLNTHNSPEDALNYAFTETSIFKF